MTDIPDEAVEAAARAMSVHWRDMHTNEALGRQRMLAEHALTAAAPLILAAQATADLRARIAALRDETREMWADLRGEDHPAHQRAWLIHRDLDALLREGE